MYSNEARKNTNNNCVLQRGNFEKKYVEHHLKLANSLSHGIHWECSQWVSFFVFLLHLMLSFGITSSCKLGWLCSILLIQGNDLTILLLMLIHISILVIMFEWSDVIVDFKIMQCVLFRSYIRKTLDMLLSTLSLMFSCLMLLSTLCLVFYALCVIILSLTLIIYVLNSHVLNSHSLCLKVLIKGSYFSFL